MYLSQGIRYLSQMHLVDAQMDRKTYTEVLRVAMQVSVQTLSPCCNGVVWYMLPLKFIPIFRFLLLPSFFRGNAYAFC